MQDTYLVTKSNTLIMSEYDLSLEEQKIILTLASLVQPSDEGFKSYTFKIKDFMLLINVLDKSKYTTIPKITKGLMQKVFEIRQDNKVTQVAWLSSAEYNKGSGTVELEFSPKLKPFMLGLQEFYTTYRLKNVLVLAGKYSIRMYEILKSNEYRKNLVIELDELKLILKTNSSAYTSYANFTNRILNPAQKELKQKTDIYFEYEEIKTGRKITALKFTVYPNNPEKGKLHLTSSEESIIESDLISEIKKQFKTLYKGNLLDKFISKMIESKGIEHIQECLNNYHQYIQGRNIANVAGDFYTFVISGYEKPVAHKGNIPQYANFEQRDYNEDDMKKFYANLND